MTELLTAAQMRAVERAAIESGEVTGLELMERAGRGVVEAVFEAWPELAKTTHRAVVLCGPGNNGGDGFVVARLLKDWGWDVEVFLYGDPAKLPPDAKVNYERWGEMGEVIDFYACQEIHLIGGHNKKTRRWSTAPLETWDDRVLVDALFGIGVDKPADERMREVVRNIELLSGPNKRVAVDLPSWLHADTGVFVDYAPCELGKMHEAVEFVPIEADLTVTFHRAKRGHVMRDGLSKCGNLVIKGIGL